MNFITSMKCLQKDKAFGVKIQTDLMGNCIKETPSIRKAFECTAKAVNEASTKNGLTIQWEKFQPQFEKHVEVWKLCIYPLYVTAKFLLICIVKTKHCHRLTESILIFIFVFDLFSCNMRELTYGYSLFTQYVETVATEPNFEKFLNDLQMIMENCF